jgi:hypothetical protein
MFSVIAMIAWVRADDASGERAGIQEDPYGIGAGA